MKKKIEQVAIRQDEAKPVPTEIIADSIVRIDAGFKKVLASGLNENAIVTLLRGMLPNVNRAEIQLVIRALPLLRKNYCTK